MTVQVFIPVCAVCGHAIYFIPCPTGSWWAHFVHPDNGHDAEPTPVSPSAVERWSGLNEGE